MKAEIYAQPGGGLLWSGNLDAPPFVGMPVSLDDDMAGLYVTGISLSVDGEPRWIVQVRP